MNIIFKLVEYQYLSMEVNRSGRKMTSFAELRKINISYSLYPAIAPKGQTFVCKKHALILACKTSRILVKVKMIKITVKVYMTQGVFCENKLGLKDRAFLHRMTYYSEVRPKAALEHSWNSASTFFIKVFHVHVTNTHNAER
jgi:hypothetical protein